MLMMTSLISFWVVGDFFFSLHLVSLDVHAVFIRNKYLNEKMKHVEGFQGDNKYTLIGD